MELRNNNKSSRRGRAARLYTQLFNKFYYYIALCLLSVTPVYAEGDTVNKSNPVAAATGNVTNQAVQFQNNGASSRQVYGPNIQCNGSTMTFSPFYMGNDTKPEVEDGYNINQNWGFQVNFMVPLDREGLRQCRAIAKRQEEKMRLDYELVRALKCAELRQRGFTFHPQSEMVVLCQDVVPISALQPPKPKKKMALAKMSTLSEQFAREEEARKAKKKTKAKRDESGRFVKDEADLETPSL